VRQAVLNAAEYLMVEITYTMELAEKNIVDSVWQEKNLKNIKRFYSFVSAAESLLTEYREPKFNRYKYVCAFPPSVYKSLQMLIMEKIFYSESLERLYKVCESKIFGPDHDNKSQMSKRKFLEKREDAEKRAVELLNELKTDLSFGELKKLIYSGKKMFDVLKNTKLLDNVKNDDEANKILKIFMDVWNYFPHKTLNGLSPLEKSHNLQEDCEEGEENQGEKLDDFFTREHGHA